jgi:hypothetical protein
MDARLETKLEVVVQVEKEFVEMGVEMRNASKMCINIPGNSAFETYVGTWCV